MTQMNRNPSRCSIGTGMFSMASSPRLEYWMATPREGCEEESLHGGSIMTTSNSRCAISSCLDMSSWKSNFVTSAQIGTAFSPTYDLAPELYASYRFVDSPLGSLACTTWFFPSLGPAAAWGGPYQRVVDRWWSYRHRYRSCPRSWRRGHPPVLPICRWCVCCCVCALGQRFPPPLSRGPKGLTPRWAGRSPQEDLSPRSTTGALTLAPIIYKLNSAKLALAISAKGELHHDS